MMIYGFDENKNKKNLEEMLGNIISKNDIAIVYGEITMSNGLGETDLNYPNGFDKYNCIVLSFMAREQSQETSEGTTGGYGYIETATGYIGGAIGHMVKMRDKINIQVNNPTFEHNSGNAVYDITLVLLKR